MKRSAAAITALLFAMFLVAVSRARAQDTAKLTAEKKQAVIDSLVKAINKTYLYPDRAPAIERVLREHLAAGAYEETSNHFSFAEKLTDDLRSRTKDLHFAVRHGSGDGTRFGAIQLRSGEGGGADGAGAGDSTPSGRGQQRTIRVGSGGAPLDPESPMYKMLHEQFRRNNFSMPKLEVLPGNVGYIRFDMMPPLDVARPTLDAAMAFLANADALIIDVRDTPGGVGGFIPYFMSYFFPDGGKLLFIRYFGAEDRSDRFLTVDKVGGKRRPDVPLYILTSSSTASAAENLAFTLKNHGRATTVGETTRGAGHSATMVPLVDGFTATIPIANVIHPETGAGFDGVGVPPNVAVPASEALDKAHELALETLLKHAPDNDKERLNSALAEIRASRDLRSGGGRGAEALQAYVGKYGARTIFLEGGQLKYRREGGPAVVLKPLGDDTFRLNTPPGVRTALALPNVRFERDDEHRVKGLSLVRDGKVEEYANKDGQ